MVEPAMPAELEQGLGAIDQEAGVHLDGDLHTVIGGEAGVLGPVGRGDFVPLPFEDFKVLGRPGAGDPVGAAGSGRIAGTAGEIDDHRHAQLLGQQDGLAADFAIMTGALGIGMERIAVATERADGEAMVVEQAREGRAGEASSSMSSLQWASPG